MLNYLKRLALAIASLRIEVRFGAKRRAAEAAKLPKRPHPQAQFEIIGLEAVRREYIAHWPSIHQRVHQIVQMIIRQNLQPGEDFRLVSRDSYAISFHRDAASAHRCAGNIRAAVMDLFIFDLKIKNLGFQMTMYPNDAPSQPAASAPPNGRAVASSVPPFDMRERGDGVARPLFIRDDEGRAVMPHGIEVVFSPIVALADNSRTCFAAFARLDMGGQYLYGYDVLPEEADGDMILDLDVRTVARICNVMQRMEKIHGYPSKMLCPVHYRTIADPTRRSTYLQAFAQLQQHGYDRFVAMQLHHMPRALYGTELQTPVEVLSRLSSRVVVMVPVDWTSTGELAEAGARAIGVDFQEMARMPPEAARVKMRNFVKQVNREKLQSYVFAVSGPLKDIALGTGFSHLCDCEVLPQFRAPAAAAPAEDILNLA